MAVLIALALFQAAIGWIIGHAKGRDWAGFWLGLGLGVIGWIIVAVLQPSHEALVRREIAAREAAREADRYMAREHEGLDDLTTSQVKALTGPQRRAYIKDGTVPVH